MIQAISGLLQLWLVGSTVLEFVAQGRLSPWYVDGPALRVATPEDLPSVGDTSRLDGLDGQRGEMRYRWDRTRQVLRFGRCFAPLQRGRHGYLVGTVRFDGAGRPEIRWRPMPVLLPTNFFLLGAYGLAHFVLVEGELEALLGVPLLAAMCGLMALFMWFNAGVALRRLILPRLAEVLRERLDVTEPSRRARG